LNEGLAEYTGYATAAPDAQSARWRIVVALTDPQAGTFVRSFAYASGPAYGLLLDERIPNWRSKLTTGSDLGDLLASATPFASHTSADQRAVRYGGTALRISETERAALADAEKAHYCSLLVDGPTLTIPNAGKFNYGYDPNTLVPLSDVGTVYPTMQVTDVWGTLAVQEGALLAPDMKSVKVAAPAATDGGHVTGPGWTLDLTPGWLIAKGDKPGSFVLRKD
jgi:hypothetical protein